MEGSEILSSSLCKQRIKSSRSRPGGEFKSSTSPPEQRRAAPTRTCAGRAKGKATLAPSARMTTDPWRPAPRSVRNLPRPLGVGAGGPRGNFSRSCSNNQTKKGGWGLGPLDASVHALTAESFYNLQKCRKKLQLLKSCN